MLASADRELEGGGEVGAASFGAHRRASSTAGDLDPVARPGPARVLLVVEHDIEVDDVAAVALETSQPLDDLRTIPVGRVGVAPRHDDFHLDVGAVLGLLRFHVTPMSWFGMLWFG
jgi:hypothetical protein